MIFTDVCGRVLLCEPTYKDVFEVPGGAVEAGESPRQAAAREVREELGLVVEPGRLIVVDYVPAVGGRTEGLVFVFAGARAIGGQIDAITLDSNELRSWSWCTPAEVNRRMRPLVARRVEAALDALAAGETKYLEAGYPTG